ASSPTRRRDSLLSERERERIHAARGIPALALVVLLGDEEQVLGLVLEPLSAAGGHGPEADAAGAGGAPALPDHGRLPVGALHFQGLGIVVGSGRHPRPLLLGILCLVLDIDRQFFFGAVFEHEIAACELGGRGAGRLSGSFGGVVGRLGIGRIRRIFVRGGSGRRVVAGDGVFLAGRRVGRRAGTAGIAAGPGAAGPSQSRAARAGGF